MRARRRAAGVRRRQVDALRAPRRPHMARSLPREKNSSPSEMKASEQKPAGTKVLAELASTLEARA